jgi:hypothetical protein
VGRAEQVSNPGGRSADVGRERNPSSGDLDRDGERLSSVVGGETAIDPELAVVEGPGWPDRLVRNSVRPAERLPSAAGAEHRDPKTCGEEQPAPRMIPMFVGEQDPTDPGDVQTGSDGPPEQGLGSEPRLDQQDLFAGDNRKCVALGAGAQHQQANHETCRS